MKNIKEKVKKLLIEYPPYRDDDQRLIATYYYRDLGGKRVIDNMTAFEFLQVFAKGKIPSPDNITRVRRRLQEQHPELRGEKYNKRHSIEEDVRKDIHEL